MTTTSPILNWTVLLTHLVCCCKVFKYSFAHRRQKCWLMAFTNFQRDRCSSRSSSRDGSGIEFRAVPMRKCPGVSVKTSSGSPCKGVKGREFRQPSTRVRKVMNSSYVKLRVPIIRLRWDLADLTAASHSPPKWGAAGGMNRQLVPPACSDSAIVDHSNLASRKEFLSSASAPLNVVALSLHTSIGMPRRLVNLWNAARKLVVVKSPTTSMCIALMLMQTKIAI